MVELLSVFPFSSASVHFIHVCGLVLGGYIYKLYLCVRLNICHNILLVLLIST